MSWRSLLDASRLGPRRAEYVGLARSAGMLLAAGGLALAVAGCGGTTAAAPTVTAVPAIVAPTSAPTATRAPALPTATAAAAASPTNTPPVVKSNTVYVGNTDGEGVFVRKTPVMADRTKAYPDGTALTIVGDDVDGDGQHWKHVKTPDGLDGYVPSTYTVDTPP